MGIYAREQRERDRRFEDKLYAYGECAKEANAREAAEEKRRLAPKPLQRTKTGEDGQLLMFFWFAMGGAVKYFWAYNVDDAAQMIADNTGTRWPRPYACDDWTNDVIHWSRK